MLEVFVAYASGNKFHTEMIKAASEAASNQSRKVLTWEHKEISSNPIAQSVEGWVERADAFVADVSVPNVNVTFEFGLAIGLGKPTRLIRSTAIDFDAVKKIGLLDTLGHDSYVQAGSLVRILQKSDAPSAWRSTQKNKDQPVYIVQPPLTSDWVLRLVSSVKKVARLKFRTFNPQEVSRLTAKEAYDDVSSSYGVIACWMAGSDDACIRNNQRASFVFGLARGMGIPALLIAHEGERLPLDLQDLATRWSKLTDFDRIVAHFRDDVADLRNDHIEAAALSANVLEQLSCGAWIAENEASELRSYFLETEGYQKTINGEANILVGRKGSGKTAIFLQTRDRTRSDKDNIVVDLIPEGFQLIKMKEYIIDQLNLGSRKEVIAAFWEYVLWLEIAYKLIEKDQQRASRDSALLERFERLERLFRARVDTGAGDFSERLRRLTDHIVERFEAERGDGEDIRTINSSKVLQIIYGEDIRRLREEVISYLKIKGHVYFLLDNLDRFWTPGGFGSDDALILIGLIESMQEINRKFHKASLDFRWSVFVRSDVYEFLVQGMADYGKLSVQSLEWNDRELLKILFERRVSTNFENTKASWREIWASASDQFVGGKPVLDYLVDGSLMRPRYLIRLFETARRRAITLRRFRIEEADYQFALKELGWQVMEDLDREIADLVPSATDFLFELIQISDGLTTEKFRYMAATRFKNEADIDRLIDVMIWNGSLGVYDREAPKYIFDCGYKRQYMARLLHAEGARLVLHPTLAATM